MSSIHTVDEKHLFAERAAVPHTPPGAVVNRPLDNTWPLVLSEAEKPD